mmetsp:Transcript_2747/g.8794  ORF Transcript_2747/g.8794 Transcript_2747/m.8794 type:complete len:207 (+) Transcript_2747:919-1539(+)
MGHRTDVCEPGGRGDLPVPRGRGPVLRQPVGEPAEVPEAPAGCGQAARAGRRAGGRPAGWCGRLRRGLPQGHGGAPAAHQPPPLRREPPRLAAAQGPGPRHDFWCLQVVRAASRGPGGPGPHGAPDGRGLHGDAPGAPEAALPGARALADQARHGPPRHAPRLPGHSRAPGGRGPGPLGARAPGPGHARGHPRALPRGPGAHRDRQ